MDTAHIRTLFHCEQYISEIAIGLGESYQKTFGLSQINLRAKLIATVPFRSAPFSQCAAPPTIAARQAPRERERSILEPQSPRIHPDLVQWGS